VFASGGGGGGGGGDTVTVNDALALPQLILKLLFPVNAPVDWVPEIALVPDHAPEAVQELTFVDDQMSDEDAPLVTSEGIAPNDTVGAPTPCTATVADALPLPPGPLQERV
jgi:hypothetical protein